MTQFEYRVVPAPKKGRRGKGVKGNDGKFANALELVMNEWAALGWEYQRTDTLPSEERQGLTGRITVFQNMLVFRRVVESEATVAPIALIEDASQADDEGMIEAEEAAVDAQEPADAPDAHAETAQQDAVSSPDEPGDYDGPQLNPALETRLEQVKAREDAST